MAKEAPQDTNALLQHAISLQDKGDLKAAVDAYHIVLSIDPNQLQALLNLAFIYTRLGQFNDAVIFYHKARSIEPLSPQVLSDFAVVLSKLQLFHEALTCYNEALEQQPKSAGIHNNRATLLKNLGRFDEALGGYNQAIKFQPNVASFYYQRGNVLMELHRFEDAVVSYDNAIKLEPEDAKAYTKRAMALNRLDRHAEALASADMALSLQPNHAETLNHRGLALRGLFRYEEALDSFNQAVALQPNAFEAIANRGNILMAVGQFRAAVADYNKALTLRPEAAEAFSNRALAKTGLHDFDGAFADYKRAMELRPDYDYILSTQGLIHLLRGNFEEGWKLFEWRWKIPTTARNKRPAYAPLWLGDKPIAGKTIIVQPEQGYGDFIQFCRYVPMLEAMGAKVILDTFPSLVPLMKSLSPTVRILTKALIPSHDYYCPIMSLPLAFKTTLATVPNHVPYLTVDAAKREEWQAKLGPKTLPRIGLVWSGSEKHLNDYIRSIPSAKLAALLELPAEFHCLQKEIRSQDRGLFERFSNLHAHDTELQDFSDTGALVEEMDLVISVDTSVAHLTGALAKPLWILLQSTPDYRWMLEREDSPWYPTARLFRQKLDEDWGPILDTLRAELEGFIREKSGAAGA